MDNIRFLPNGEQVTFIRDFRVGGKHLAEIKCLNMDESEIVDFASLLVKYEFYQPESVSRIVQTPDMVKLEVKDDNFVSTVTIESNRTSAKIESVTTKKGSEEPEGEIVAEWEDFAMMQHQQYDHLDTSEVQTLDDLVKPKQIIIATSTKNGNTFKLGDITKLATNASVKKFKLDPEAIKRVLDGKQKQHKGFTFEIK